MNTYTLPLALGAAGFALGHLVDQGAANFTGLATLRHGTNPLSWISIHITGALPVCGASRIGGDASLGDPHQMRTNYFYMSRGSGTFNALPPIFSIQIKRWMPRSYTYLSTNNLLKTVYLPGILRYPIAFLTTLVLPTIRFRFPQATADAFEKDPAAFMGNIACRTNAWISPVNIGSVGTIWHSLTYKTPIRMAQHPLRVITGIFQLAIAAKIAQVAWQRYPAQIMTHKTALLAGAILGMI